MEILTLVVAFALAALLVTRELWCRHEAAALREQLHAASALGLERDQFASVGQLVSGLAQELKSPLQGVLGNTELLVAMASPGAGSAEDHGGSLEVDQSIDRGFRFQLELPVTAGGAEALAAS
jgi:signal transduction histidine kinase